MSGAFLIGMIIVALIGLIVSKYPITSLKIISNDIE
jgi:hypothetical protein